MPDEARSPAEFDDNAPLLENFIDWAIEAQGLTSERQLSKALGVTPSVVNNWKKHKNWPSDIMMNKLASLADFDQAEALLWLNYWRTTKATRPIYQAIIETLESASKPILHTLLLMLVFGFPPQGTAPEQSNDHVSKSVYYGKYLKTFWLRATAFFNCCCVRVFSQLLPKNTWSSFARCSSPGITF